MNLAQPSRRCLPKLYSGSPWMRVQPRTLQHRFSYSAQFIRNSQKGFTHKLFQLWQDLSLEATGSDTVWGYPVALMHIVERLGISELNLITQLAQLEMSKDEYTENPTAITFHSPNLTSAEWV